MLSLIYFYHTFVMILLEVSISLPQNLNELIENCAISQFLKHGDFVFGLIIGILIAYFYHRFLGLRSIKKSYETLLQAKNETIEAYSEMIGEKLGKIQVNKVDKYFFKKLKEYFRRKYN